MTEEVWVGTSAIDLENDAGWFSPPCTEPVPGKEQRLDKIKLCIYHVIYPPRQNSLSVTNGVCDALI